MEEIWAHLKRANLRIIGIEEGKEVEANGINNIFNEVMSKNFPNIEKEVNTQMQETYRTPHRQDQRKGSSCHIIVKLTNVEVKERIFFFFCGTGDGTQGHSTSKLYLQPIFILYLKPGLTKLWRVSLSS